MIIRKPLDMVSARHASDGAGVKLMRVFGGAQPERFDPFLLLDEFGSDESSDYIAGFPSHPHRGFETITYMLQGKMEHRDHMENVGLLSDGDVQWMTAGHGVIHSEMPKQTEGKMRGFQLWLNLSAKDKMQAAKYEDLPHAKLPRFEFDGGEIVAIAGEGQANDQPVKGYFSRPETEPVYWDIHSRVDAEVSLKIPEKHTAMIYVYDGQLDVCGMRLYAQHLVRLGEGELIHVANKHEGESRFLLVAGRPLQEPIVQYGPFVMNTREEIEQAISDYKAGKLTAE